MACDFLPVKKVGSLHATPGQQQIITLLGKQNALSKDIGWLNPLVKYKDEFRC